MAGLVPATKQAKKTGFERSSRDNATTLWLSSGFRVSFFVARPAAAPGKEQDPGYDEHRAQDLGGRQPLV
jgi:hypothetical protein